MNGWLRKGLVVLVNAKGKIPDSAKKGGREILIKNKINTMKILNLFGLLVCCVILFSNCSNDQQIFEANNQLKAETRSTSDFIPFNLDFPDGTEFNEIGTTVFFNLPAPYYLLGIDSDGTYHRSTDGGDVTDGGVTCDCDSGSGGCSPTKIGKKYGCAMSSCRTCTKTDGISGTDNNLADMVIINPDGSGFITDFDDLIGKTLMPPVFMESVEMTEFFDFIHDNIIQSNSTETRVMLMSAYGHVIPLIVPADLVQSSISFRTIGSSDVADIDCLCNDEGSCPLGGNIFAKWCDADNCKSCTMSGIVVNENGDEKLFSIINGIINID